MSETAAAKLRAKLHRVGVAKMRARMKHMAKEKVGTSSTNTDIMLMAHDFVAAEFNC